MNGRIAFMVLLLCFCSVVGVAQVKPTAQEADRIGRDGGRVRVNAGGAIDLITPSGKQITLKGMPIVTGHSAFGGAGVIDDRVGANALSAQTIGTFRESFTDPTKAFSLGIHSRVDARPSSSSNSQYAALLGSVYTASGDTSSFTNQLIPVYGYLEHNSGATISSVMGGLFNVENKAAGPITTARGVNIILKNSSTATVTTGIGLQSQVLNSSTGTLSDGRGVQASISNTGGGAIPLWYGYQSVITNTGSGSVITTAYGYYTRAITQSGGGSITNLYGVYLTDWSSYSSNAYNFFSAGATARNYIEGKLGVGVTTNDAAAKVQIDSTTQGFLPPRMTTTQRDAISSPPEGLQIYNTTTHQMNYYNGTTWVAF
ncbi:MAG TPA: hypothetical protein VF735_06650 [Pyrinomonadaceae bacterium]|jgi:hypothetical protein